MSQEYTTALSTVKQHSITMWQLISFQSLGYNCPHENSSQCQANVHYTHNITQPACVPTEHAHQASTNDGLRTIKQCIRNHRSNRKLRQTAVPPTSYIVLPGIPRQ